MVKAKRKVGTRVSKNFNSFPQEEEPKKKVIRVPFILFGGIVLAIVFLFFFIMNMMSGSENKIPDYMTTHKGEPVKSESISEPSPETKPESNSEYIDGGDFIARTFGTLMTNPLLIIMLFVVPIVTMQVMGRRHSLSPFVVIMIIIFAILMWQYFSQQAVTTVASTPMAPPQP